MIEKNITHSTGINNNNIKLTFEKNKKQIIILISIRLFSEKHNTIVFIYIIKRITEMDIQRDYFNSKVVNIFYKI